jgi:hypothetical protein
MLALVIGVITLNACASHSPGSSGESRSSDGGAIEVQLTGDQLERITEYLDSLPYVASLGRRLTKDEVADPRVTKKRSSDGVVEFEVFSNIKAHGRVSSLVIIRLEESSDGFRVTSLAETLLHAE